jgi:quercetin dioxygenase-like cupin family protein
MSTPIRVVAIVFVLLLLGFAALHTGLARHAFFWLFAWVKGVDVVSPTVVRELPEDSPYQQWLERVRGEVPVREGLVIENVHEVALEPWPQLGEGITGLYLHFADYQMTDGRIVGIPAGGHTIEQRHLYEKAVYVLQGSGYSLIRQDDTAPRRFDWEAGDLFSIPLNASHRLHAGPQAARLLLVTDFPLMLNLFDDEPFLTGNPYLFTGRWDGGPGFFDAVDNTEDLAFTTQFVDDVPTTVTQPFDYRGKGNRSVRWEMAGNTALSMHVSEMPPRMYKKAHRHAGDAFILLLSGEGFSLAWPEGAYHQRVRIDWRRGTLFVPPTFWYHQHLNTGAEPARYLAINAPSAVRNMGLRFIDQLEVDIEEIREEWAKAVDR